MNSSVFEQLWDSPAAFPRSDSPRTRVIGGEGISRASDIAEASQVASLAVRVPFALDAPMPRLEELFVDGTLAAEAGELAPLLRAATVWNPYPSRRSELSGIAHGIVDLIVEATSLPSAESFVNLDRLQARGTIDGAWLEALAPLRWLAASPQSRVAGALRRQDRLERLDLELERGSVEKLSLLGPKPQLSHASLSGGGVRALDGVESWTALNCLRLHCVGARSLAPLGETGVRELEIYADASAPFKDIASLGRMARVEHVRFTHRGPTIDSFGSWAEARACREVQLGFTALAPNALDGLIEAPALRAAWFSTRCEAVERFSAARPDVVVHVDSAGRTPDAILGAVELFDNGPQGWSIFQDLAGSTGMATNSDVEEAVRSALGPEASQVQFDTEAGGFSASAPSREQIESIATVINGLAEPDRP